MTEVKGKFRLEEAIDKAYDEFVAYDEDKRHMVNAVILGRKYVPHSAKHIIDCLEENPGLLWYQAKPGAYLVDVVSAALAEIISSAVLERYQKDVTESNRKEAQKIALRETLAGKR